MCVRFRPVARSCQRARGWTRIRAPRVHTRIPYTIRSGALAEGSLLNRLTSRAEEDAAAPIGV